MSYSINQKNIKELTENQKIENNNIIKVKNYSILSLLIEKKQGTTLKTINSNSFIQINEKEINKIDELNNSLSYISDFDLEKEDESDSSSFNSLENDEKNIENIIIIKKSNVDYDIIENNREYEFELDKEFEEIQKEIFREK